MKIDFHVHVVGNGRRGSGCWYHPRSWTKLGQPIMLRSFGLPRDALEQDLETLYVARLRELIRTSSLDAAVILAQDDPYEASGKKIENVASFYVPNSYVLGLAQKHAEFFAAISIHPARVDALEELERCLESGAAVLKCLPNCQNIDWNDRRYTRFLERMAEAKLPLLAHTGAEHTLPVIAKRLQDPRVLTRALEIGVTCIAAHCGTCSFLPGDPDYFPVFAEMTRKFPNLYGDNSAFCCSTRLYGNHVPECLAEPLASRILHGSDLPVLVIGLEAWLRGYISWAEFRASWRERNPLERDAQLKRAMGFSEETFTARRASPTAADHEKIMPGVGLGPPDQPEFQDDSRHRSENRCIRKMDTTWQRK